MTTGPQCPRQSVTLLLTFRTRKLLPKSNQALFGPKKKDPVSVGGSS